jgi:hypothetical protein
VSGPPDDRPGVLRSTVARGFNDDNEGGRFSVKRSRGAWAFGNSGED